MWSGSVLMTYNCSHIGNSLQLVSNSCIQLVYSTDSLFWSQNHYPVNFANAVFSSWQLFVTHRHFFRNESNMWHSLVESLHSLAKLLDIVVISRKAKLKAAGKINKVYGFNAFIRKIAGNGLLPVYGVIILI